MQPNQPNKSRWRYFTGQKSPLIIHLVCVAFLVFPDPPVMGRWSKLNNFTTILIWLRHRMIDSKQKNITNLTDYNKNKVIVDKMC